MFRSTLRSVAASAAALMLWAGAVRAQDEREHRRGPFATRPAVFGALGIMLPTGTFADRYASGPTVEGGLHLPLAGRVLLSLEAQYARLPVLGDALVNGLPPVDGRLISGSGVFIVPVGSSRLPVPGLGGGAPYLVVGGGLAQFNRERRNESFRPSATGGLGLSFDAPGHHEAFIETRVTTFFLTGQTGVTVPITVGFRW
jgi:hypothetical protein